MMHLRNLPLACFTSYDHLWCYIHPSMGVQNRDGYEEAKISRESGDMHGHHSGTPPRAVQRQIAAHQSLRPVWLVLFTIALCLAVFGAFKLASSFSSTPPSGRVYYPFPPKIQCSVQDTTANAELELARVRKFAFDAGVHATYTDQYCAGSAKVEGDKGRAEEHELRRLRALGPVDAAILHSYCSNYATSYNNLRHQRCLPGQKPWSHAR
jgi:hypothetical protein